MDTRLVFWKTSSPWMRLLTSARAARADGRALIDALWWSLHQKQTFLFSSNFHSRCRWGFKLKLGTKDCLSHSWFLTVLKASSEEKFLPVPSSESGVSPLSLQSNHWICRYLMKCLLCTWCEWGAPGLESLMSHLAHSITNIRSQGAWKRRDRQRQRAVWGAFPRSTQERWALGKTS